MTIIQMSSREDGQHDIQSQSRRRAVWLPGYIEVPAHLEAAAWSSCGYCDLTIENGVLVGITHTERPEPEPVEPTVDELTMTQLAVAELAQTVEDNNTANQLAIAELAELMTGGGA